MRLLAPHQAVTLAVTFGVTLCRGDLGHSEHRGASHGLSHERAPFDPDGPTLTGQETWTDLSLSALVTTSRTP